MFELVTLLRLLTIISSFFMIGSAFCGFIQHDCVTEVIVSIHILLVGILIFYYEFFNQNKIKEWFHNHFIFRTIILVWNNILILGINNITLGFGIYGIIIGASNGLYFLINDKDENQELLPN